MTVFPRGWMLRISMAMTVSAVAAALGCYYETTPSPSFRYRCNSTDDCETPETCIDGLCQIPCTQATFDEDCPDDGRFVACFNGVCASTCSRREANCPAPQECIEFGPRYSGLLARLGQSDRNGLGLCGNLCDGQCNGNEVCGEGFCFATCDPALPMSSCAPGLICSNGFCVPADLPELGGADDQ